MNLDYNNDFDNDLRRTEMISEISKNFRLTSRDTEFRFR